IRGCVGALSLTLRPHRPHQQEPGVRVRFERLRQELPIIAGSSQVAGEIPIYLRILPASPDEGLGAGAFDGAAISGEFMQERYDHDQGGGDAELRESLL